MRRLFKTFVCMLLTHNWVNVYDMRTAQHLQRVGDVGYTLMSNLNSGHQPFYIVVGI